MDFSSCAGDALYSFCKSPVCPLKIFLCFQQKVCVFIYRDDAVLLATNMQNRIAAQSYYFGIFYDALVIITNLWACIKMILVLKKFPKIFIPPAPCKARQANFSHLRRGHLHKCRLSFQGFALPSDTQSSRLCSWLPKLLFCSDRLFE